MSLGFEGISQGKVSRSSETARQSTVIKVRCGRIRLGSQVKSGFFYLRVKQARGRRAPQIFPAGLFGGLRASHWHSAVVPIQRGLASFVGKMLRVFWGWGVKIRGKYYRERDATLNTMIFNRSTCQINKQEYMMGLKSFRSNKPFANHSFLHNLFPEVFI